MSIESDSFGNWRKSAAFSSELDIVFSEFGVPALVLSLETMVSEYPRLALYRDVANELIALRHLNDTISGEINSGPESPKSFDDETQLLIHVSRDNAWQDKLSVLVELRRSAYGKVVTLQALDGVLKTYRMPQANKRIETAGDVKFPINIVNRLSTEAKKLIPSVVGEMVELDGTPYKVVSVDLLGRSAACPIVDFSIIRVFAAGTSEFPEIKQMVVGLTDALYAWISTLWQFRPDPSSESGATIFSSRQVAEYCKPKGIDGWRLLIGVTLTHKYFGIGSVTDVRIDQFAADGIAIDIKFPRMETSFQPGNFSGDTFSNIMFSNDSSPKDLNSDKSSVVAIQEDADIQRLTEVTENLGLSSDFYTRTTRTQEESIRKLHGGLLIVEGIAGSGKTSVALGRIKALHDSRLGDETGAIDKFFDDRKSMIGFVRSPQLVEYLKNTIDDLNLSGMHVAEFDAIRHGLAVHRAPILQLKTGKTSKGLYRPVPSSPRAAFEGEMVWIRDLLTCITEIYLERIRSGFEQYLEFEFTQNEHLKYRSIEGKDYDIVDTSIWDGIKKEGKRLIQDFIDGAYRSNDGKWPEVGIITRAVRCYVHCCRYLSSDFSWYINQQEGTLSIKPDQRSIPEKILDHSRYPKEVDRKRVNAIQSQHKKWLQRVFLLGDAQESAFLLSDYFGVAINAMAKESRYPSEKLQRIADRLLAYHLMPQDLTALLALTELMTRGMTEDDEKSARDISKVLRRSREHSYKAVFIDEVQDFTEVEVFLMSSLANPERKAVTAVGDFRQQLYPGTVSSLPICFPYASEKELISVVLNENKRQIPLLAIYSAQYREFSAGKGTSPPKPAKSGEVLSLEIVSEQSIPERIGELVGETEIGTSVAVICPTPELAKILCEACRTHVEDYFRSVSFSTDSRDLIKTRYCHFTDPRPTKGLEFDFVIVPFYEQFDHRSFIGRNASYVAISRARRRLVLLSATGL
jgi:hypothetical protein